MKTTPPRHHPETAQPWQANGPRRCITPRRKDSPTIDARSIAVQLLVAGILAVGAGSASAQSNAELLQEIRALKARLQELESKVGAPATPAAKPAAPAAKDEASKLNENVKWSEIIAGKSHFKIYGFLRADAIFDDSRPGAGTGAGNATLIPAYILNENPAAVAGLGGIGNTVNNAPSGNQKDFTVHPRLTRLGMDFTGPELEALWGAKTGGKLEIDFYNIPAGAAESREFPRMRHAYLTLKWDEAALLAGQTSDLISPYFPVVNPDFVMWGAGNLGDRRPQFRFDYTPKVGPGTLFLQAMAGMTGADDNVSGGAIRAGEASGLPTLQGRVAYRYPIADKLNAELGGWVHFARERFDAGVGTSGRQTFFSEAAGIDLSVPLYKDIVSLKGELWTGKNLDDVRGGILQGINATTGQEIHSDGGWAELTFRPKKWYSLHGGYLFDNPRHADLMSGTGAVVTGNARDLNSIWYLAGRLYFDPIELGLDYLNWTTYYSDNVGKGQDNRLQAYISYKF